MLAKSLMTVLALVMVLGFSAAGFAAVSEQSSVDDQQTGAMDQGYTNDYNYGADNPDYSYGVENTAPVMEHRYGGLVTSYDQTGNTLIVKGRHGERVFDLENATVSGNIRPNEHVVVSYTDFNGTLLALSVSEMGTGSQGYGATMSDQPTGGKLDSPSGGSVGTWQSGSPQSAGTEPGSVD